MLDGKWLALYLGQPRAVGGETDIIDLSDSAASSAVLCVPSLKSLLSGKQVIKRFQLIFRP